MNMKAAPAKSPDISQAKAPNVFRPQSVQPSLHIVYSTNGFNGGPYLQYSDSTQTLNFSGDQVRSIASEIGTLVSVTIRQTTDAGSTSFTTLVPAVNLVGETATPISTYGVTTLHRFSIIPGLNEGQTEIYAIAELQGSAQLALVKA